MAEFYVSLNEREMARQIADMINQHNRWVTRFSADSILLTAARYFVEIEGHKVVGCASNIKEYDNISKIQHICVLPSHRRLAIGRKLTELAIANSPTEYVYMNIREDNIASLGLAGILGFRYATKHWFRDHWTLTFSRRRNVEFQNQISVC